MDKLYSTIRLYGFGGFGQRAINDLYNEELYVKHCPHKISNLLKHLQHYIFFELHDITMYIDDVECDSLDILPPGGILNLVHKLYQKYLITLKSSTQTFNILKDTLSTAEYIFDSHFKHYVFGSIIEINWDGTLKKVILDKIRKTKITKIPNSILTEYTYDIKSRNDTFIKQCQYMDIKKNTTLISL
jgi:hypothetical protein